MMSDPENTSRPEAEPSPSPNENVPPEPVPTPPVQSGKPGQFGRWLRAAEKWIEHVALVAHLYIIFEAVKHGFGWMIPNTASVIT